MKNKDKIFNKIIFIFIITFTLMLKVDADILKSKSSYIYNGKDKEWRLVRLDNNGNEKAEYFCLTKDAHVDQTCNFNNVKNDLYGTNSGQLRAAIGRAIADYNTLHSTLVIGPNGSTSNAGYMVYGIQLVIHKILAEKEGLVGLSGSLAFSGFDFTPHYNASIADYDAYDNTVSLDNLSFSQSGDYFVSNVITPTGGYGNGFYYSLTINGVANTSYLKDVSGGKQIKIPVSDVTSNMDVSLTVSARRQFYMVDFIKCADGKQDIVSTGYRTETKTIDKTVSASITPVKGTITLKKVNNMDSIINSGAVKVNIYNDIDCSNSKEIISFTGTKKLEYDRGWYSVKEIEAPPHYEKDESCHNFFIETGIDNGEVIIKNKSTCVLDVIDLIEAGIVNNREERIKIYKKYGGGDKHRNLLNFTNPYVSGDDKEDYANKACQSPDRLKKTALPAYCLNVGYSHEFNENNWTHYTETIDVSTNTGYCYSLLSFNRDSSIPLRNLTIADAANGSKTYFSLSDIDVKAGTFVFRSNTLGTMTLTKKCYFANDVGGVLSDYFSDYVYSLKFNGIEITPNISNEGKFDILKQSYSDEIGSYFEGSITATYNLSDVKVKKISGKICTDSAYDCVSKGSGLLSEFQDGKNTGGKLYINSGGKKYVVVPFSISLNEDVFANSISFGESDEKLSQACVYPVAPEIIKYDKNTSGQLELEFRSIDPYKPFERETKSNWCSGNNCDASNPTVINNIINSNNSYNRTGQGSLYTNQSGSNKIILTPAIIESIRSYNASVGSYEKSVYERNESGVLVNKFLNDFNIIKN